MSALAEVKAAEHESGAILLDELRGLLARYVAFPSDAALDAVALWVVHCHAVEAFESTPRLAMLSPEKGSGKTRTLEVLALLVPSPVHAVNMSAAALYRMVDERQPTLLLDEADTYLGNVVQKQHEDLGGLINAGHRRGATVYRGEVLGKAVKVVEFPAYAACALAGIGDLPDTILDRSVIVSMKRRAPHEHVEPFRERLARPHADALRGRIATWAAFRFDVLHWRSVAGARCGETFACAGWVVSDRRQPLAGGSWVRRCDEFAGDADLLDDDVAAVVADDVLNLREDVVGQYGEVPRVPADLFVLVEVELDEAAGAVGIRALADEADRLGEAMRLREFFDPFVDGTEQRLITRESRFARLEIEVLGHLCAPRAPQVAGGWAASEVSRDAKLVAVREGLSSSDTVAGFFRTCGGP